MPGVGWALIRPVEQLNLLFGIAFRSIKSKMPGHPQPHLDATSFILGVKSCQVGHGGLRTAQRVQIAGFNHQEIIFLFLITTLPNNV